jgi:prepilin-type N-terminal cleavage/methylation domain-containing protein
MRNKGFTLIELMVAIAIVAILAAILMVNMQGYAKDARASKALASLSSTVPSMISCWGNSGSSDYVKKPSSGDDICSISSSYGQWPKTGNGTDLSTYNYSSNASSGQLTKPGWFVALASDSSGDNKTICCNSTMNNCAIISVTCDQNATW